MAIPNLNERKNNKMQRLTSRDIEAEVQEIHTRIEALSAALSRQGDKASLRIAGDECAITPLRLTRKAVNMVTIMIGAG